MEGSENEAGSGSGGGGGLEKMHSMDDKQPTKQENTEVSNVSPEHVSNWLATKLSWGALVR